MVREAGVGACGSGNSAVSTIQLCSVTMPEGNGSGWLILAGMQSIPLKGESFRPGMKVSSNYKVHTFEVFTRKYQQTAQFTGI